MKKVKYQNVLTILESEGNYILNDSSIHFPYQLHLGKSKDPKQLVLNSFF